MPCVQTAFGFRVLSIKTFSLPQWITLASFQPLRQRVNGYLEVSGTPRGRSSHIKTNIFWVAGVSVSLGLRQVRVFFLFMNICLFDSLLTRFRL